MARAIAVSRAMAAAACTAGRHVPARVAVPSAGSEYRLTLACRWASLRRCSAPSGSAAITARRSAARSCPLVCCPARGSTLDSTARAVSSSSGLVASAIRRARYRSMCPAFRAAQVAGSFHRSVTPRLVQAIAAGWARTSSRPTVDAAAGVTWSGRPSVETRWGASRAAGRRLGDGGQLLGLGPGGEAAEGRGDAGQVPLRQVPDVGAGDPGGQGRAGRELVEDGSGPVARRRGVRRDGFPGGGLLVVGSAGLG